MEGHCRYQIVTESPTQRRPILLDRSDLLLAGSFDPYYDRLAGFSDEMESQWTQQKMMKLM